MRILPAQGTTVVSTPKRVQSVQSGQQRTDAAQGVVPGSIPGCWLIGGRDGAGAGVAKFARAFGGDGFGAGLEGFFLRGPVRFRAPPIAA